MKKIIIFLNLLVAIPLLHTTLNSDEAYQYDDFPELTEKEITELEKFEKEMEDPEKRGFFGKMFEQAQEFLKGLGDSEETQSSHDKTARKKALKAEKEVVAEIKPSKQVLVLKRLCELSNKLSKKIKSPLFGIEFSDSLKPFISGQVKVTKEIKKGKEISAKEEKPKEKVSYEISGLVGLNVLTKNIESKKTYRTAIDEKEFETLHKKMNVLLNALSDIFNEIDNLEIKYPERTKSLKEDDEEELLRQYLMPREKRRKKVVSKLIKKQDEKSLSNLKRRIFKYFKEDISDILKELEKVVTKPEVVKKIEERTKRREDLARRYQIPPPYSTPYYSPSNTSSYQPSSYTPRSYDDYGDYGSSYGGYSGYPASYQYPYTTQSQQKSEQPTASSAPEKSKSKFYRPTKSKETKTSPEVMSLNNVIKKAVSLLREICSEVKSSTNIDDKVLRKTLKSKSDKIINLENTLSEIGKEKAKTSKLSKENLSLVSQEETELNDTTLECMNSIIKLAKYGYIYFQEKSDGHWEIKNGHPAQQTIRNIYSKLKQRLPKQYSVQVEKKEKQISQEIESHIKKEFIQQLSKINIPTLGSSEKDNILETPSQVIDNQLKNSLRLLQLVISAKNQPYSFTLTTNDVKSAKIDQITKLESFAIGIANKDLFNKVHQYQEKNSGEYEATASETIILLEDKFPDVNFEKKFSLNKFLFPYLSSKKQDDWKTYVLDKFNDDVSSDEKNKTLNTMRELAQNAYLAHLFNRLDKIIKVMQELRRQLPRLKIPASTTNQINRNPIQEPLGAFSYGFTFTKGDT